MTTGYSAVAEGHQPVSCDRRGEHLINVLLHSCENLLRSATSWLNCSARLARSGTNILYVPGTVNYSLNVPYTILDFRLAILD